MKTMTKRLCLINILFCLTVLPSFASSYLEQALHALDAAVANKDMYVKAKEAEIGRLKNNLRVAKEPTDRYLSSLQIAGAYGKFNSDSSFVYLKKCLLMGLQSSNKAWMQQAVINGAFTYADRGDILQSKTELEIIGDISKAEPRLRADYAKAALMGFITLISTSDTTGKGHKASEYWNRYGPYLSRNDAYYYFFYLNLLSKFKSPGAVEQILLSRLRRVKPYSEDAAMYHITLSHIYTTQGKKEQALREAILSAIADVRCANRSSIALIIVAETLSRYDNAENLARLQAYLALCEENVNNFKDAGRAVMLLRVENRVHTLISRQEKDDRLCLEILLSAMAILAVCCVIVVVRMHNKERNMRAEYSRGLEAHRLTVEETERQKDVMETLRSENADLRSRVSQTDATVVKSMRLIADILTANRDYKRKMHNYLFSGMVKEAKHLAGPSSMKEDAAQLFYQHFDDAFLSLHPDFVSRFNALLQDDRKLTPENDHSLTPELRIYALICMGIEDSVIIAEILMYSPQTIYNYRLKIRHSTKEPGFKIASYVKEMYRQ